MKWIKKARQHKYLSRKKVGNRWVYVYPDKAGDRHNKDAKASAKAFAGDFSVGDSFSAGAGQGHWHVQDIRDGKVTYKDDETGFVNVLPVAEFKKRITDAHRGMIEAHAQDGLRMRETVLEAAKKHGSDKQIARAEKLLAEWKQKHKDHLPTSKGGGKIDVKLAVLKGSEKQVKWAEDIRDRFMKQAKGLDGAWFDHAEQQAKQLLAETDNPIIKIQAEGTLSFLADMRIAVPKMIAVMGSVVLAKSWIDGREALKPSSPEAALKLLDGFFGKNMKEFEGFNTSKDLAIQDLLPLQKKTRSEDMIPAIDEASSKAADNPAAVKLLRTAKAYHLGTDWIDLQHEMGKAREVLKQAMSLTGKGKIEDALELLIEDKAEAYKGEAAKTRLMQELSMMRGVMLLAHSRPTMHSAGKAILEKASAPSETSAPKEAPAQPPSQTGSRWDDLDVPKTISSELIQMDRGRNALNVLASDAPEKAVEAFRAKLKEAAERHRKEGKEPPEIIQAWEEGVNATLDKRLEKVERFRERLNKLNEASQKKGLSEKQKATAQNLISDIHNNFLEHVLKPKIDLDLVIASPKDVQRVADQNTQALQESLEKEKQSAPKSQKTSLKSRIDAMPDGKAKSYLAARTKQLEQDLSGLKQKEAEISERIESRGVQGSEAVDLKDIQNRIKSLSNGLEKMSKMSDGELEKLAEAANAGAKKQFGGR